MELRNTNPKLEDPTRGLEVAIVVEPQEGQRKEKKNKAGEKYHKILRDTCKSI